MKARIVMIIMAVALIALPAMAQDWQSTSTMQGSGSTYSSQVTGVGAASVDNMATTTTDSYSPAKAGQRRLPGGTNEPNQSEDSPVGDALIPLMLFACAYLIIRAMRRKNIEKA
jgi:ABC-type phosphate transport system substrate-binding protein